MRILLVMDPFIPVPPERYGGIERVIYDIACKYVEMGHSVTIVAGPKSKSPDKLIVYGENGEGSMKIDYKLLLTVRKILLEEIPKHDVLHNFGRLAFLMPVAWTKIRKVQTYMRFITPRNISLLNKFGIKNIIYTGVSDAIVSTGAPGGGEWTTVYNCAPIDQFTFRDTVAEDAPLVFLGRLERCKGAHSAIKAARLANRKLIIAGNISTLPDEKAYFENEVLPEVDNKLIFFIGEVDNAKKNELLGSAAALLIPIEWFEPFPVVMPEAYACGTPVLAFPGGGVPEGIVEGSTGFLSNTPEEMAEQIKKIPLLSRKACRQLAVERYSDTVIANNYLDVYRTVIPNHKNKTGIAGKKRIVIVTTGQPATNPRVMKEYEALVQKGYAVKVLYTYSADWAQAIDEVKFNKGFLKKQDFILVGGDPKNKKFIFFLSRLFLKLHKSLMIILPLGFIKDMGISRPAFYLWHKAAHFKADLYIAHYLGALPGAKRAAKKNNAALIFDAEDFHRGEPVYYAEQNKQIIEIEDRYLPAVSMISTASPLISEAYSKLYPQKKIITLNNVFSKKYIQELKHSGNGPLKLFWFSQNIGPNRGLELIIDALNILQADISLHLLGNAKNPDYILSLQQRIKLPATMHLLKPVDPDQVFKVAAAYDIGLASEIPHCSNRDICLTNKIFTYLLAGNCVLASDTAAQKQLLETYKDIGLIYQHNNAEDLAKQIKIFVTDKEALNKFKKNAQQVVEQELNWEKEREKLYTSVEDLLNNNKTAPALL